MAPVTLPGTAGPCDGKARAILLERSKRRDSAPGEGTSEGGGLARWPLVSVFFKMGKRHPLYETPAKGLAHGQHDKPE